MDQKIKNYLGIVGILGILIAGIVAWRIGDTYSKSIQPGSYRSFSVSADGKSVAIPDIANFNFQVIVQGGKNLGDLQNQNSAKTNKAIAFLKANGVDEKDIKTSSYNVDPRYQYSNCGSLGGETCPPPEIVGYTITQSVAVKVRNLAKAGELISGVVNYGANSVSQLSFTLDNPDAAKAAARKEAIDKAKAKALIIAEEGGFFIGKLISIQINDQPQLNFAYGLGGGVATNKAESAPAPSIQPGSEEINVNVYLTYEIL